MIYKFTLFLTICLFMSACKNEEKVEKESLNKTSQAESKLDEYFIALSKLKEFNGSLLIHRNEQEILRKAYNINSDRNSSTFVTNESQFEIHSVSKLMATVLIIKLESQGKIDRSDNLNTFFSDFPNGDKITIQHLLDHKSGLPRDFTNLPLDKFDLTPEQMIDFAKKEKLEFEPGTDRLYSNIGFQIIFSLIAKITKKPFEQFLKDEILDPLQMNFSGGHFYVDNDNLKRLARSHQLKDNIIVQIENLTKDEYRQARIYSTTDDLMLFLDFVKTEPFKSILKSENGVIHKNGGSDGSRAHIYTNTILNYSFVLLSNYDEFNFSQTSKDIVNILEGKPYDIPKEVNRKSVQVNTEILQQYIGKYDFTAINHTVLEFKVVDNNLVLFQDDKKLAILFAESDNVFFEDPKSRDSFKFKKDNTHKLVYEYKGLTLEAVRIMDIQEELKKH